MAKIARSSASEGPLRTAPGGRPVRFVGMDVCIRSTVGLVCRIACSVTKQCDLPTLPVRTGTGTSFNVTGRAAPHPQVRSRVSLCSRSETWRRYAPTRVSTPATMCAMTVAILSCAGRRQRERTFYHQPRPVQSSRVSGALTAMTADLVHTTVSLCHHWTAF